MDQHGVIWKLEGARPEEMLNVERVKSEEAVPESVGDAGYWVGPTVSSLRIRDMIVIKSQTGTKTVISPITRATQIQPTPTDIPICKDDLSASLIAKSGTGVSLGPPPPGTTSPLL